MPAYNAERYIGQSIQSVLAQTHEDFELIVVDDGSTDSTRDVVLQYDDPRLRLLDNPRNLGIVEARNRAMAAARGRYVACIDADDVCTPTRFARQVAVLGDRRDLVMVSTEMSVLSRGSIRFTRGRPEADLKALRWTLHLSNPIGHPATMFRAETVQRLGEYMRPEFQYAEDFDFTHRLLTIGDVFVIPEYLVIYRQHSSNVTTTRRGEMIRASAAVLGWVYGNLLQEECGDRAALVARHLLSGEPVTDRTTWERLRDTLDLAALRFHSAYGTDTHQQQMVQRISDVAWQGAVRRSLSAGHLVPAIGQRWRTRRGSASQPTVRAAARSVASGVFRRMQRSHVDARPVPAPGFSRLLLNGAAYEPVPPSSDQPPVLYVVVDTEAEFDWSKPFSRTSTDVTATARQVLAQEIFDGHGLRPIYLIDYAIASQPAGYEPLRRILDRHGCVIGAHLHPWINPPLEEHLSERNSFAGNLTPDLEFRKLQTLVAMIEQNFSIRPLFFKAGRYGTGASTMDALDRLGFKVDFSIMPLADMRAKGGPDFRFAEPCPYRTGAGEILSLPMTRGQVGALAPLPPRVHAMMHSPHGLRLRLPGILSRAGLLNTVTLTPEGVTAREQVSLIQAMIERGHRVFVLHYHSPTLGMFTPYVQNQFDLDRFLGNIRTVCDHFFRRLGGLAGNPADLLPASLRGLVWPKPGPAAGSISQQLDGKPATGGVSGT